MEQTFEQAPAGIGVDAHELNQIFEKYRAGKKALDTRIVTAEEYWKLRHWDSIRAERNPGEPEPTSGWLVNVIMSKHSDAIDAYPEPVCLPREQSDDAEAKMLSSILPVVLEQNDFAQVWSDVWWYKLKSGTGVYGVFWDAGKHNGLGDIAIRKMDILNLFWEPGIRDIQDSRYVFSVAVRNNDELEATYPQLAGKLGNNAAGKVMQYHYDDSISMDGKSLVVDCYYKMGGGVHLVKYVGEEILFDTGASGSPLYDHGMYPFVFDALFPEEGYPNCGYGYVDLCKSTQHCIDIINNAAVQNTIAAATPRWFVRKDGGVNEAEYADLTQKFVHVTGRMDEDSVKQIVTQPVPSQVFTHMDMLVNSMKETSGNRDVNNGGTGASVTAASAIAALQEAGNGLSRDMNNTSYRAFRKVVEMCIELIRQFYTLPRQFRITGAEGVAQYVSYSNAGIQPQQSVAPGGEMSVRKPVFDIEVEVQVEAQYTKEAYNQLAIQLYQLGAFNPQMADQALLMLGMMDFKGKTEIVQSIRQNQMMYQQNMLLAMAQQQQATVSQQTDEGQTSVERARGNAQQGAIPR